MTTVYDIPPEFPKSARKLLNSRTPKKKLVGKALEYQSFLTRKYGNDILVDLGFHPIYPFARLFPLTDAYLLPKQLAHLYWCLTSAYTIAFEFQTYPIRSAIRSYRQDKEWIPPFRWFMRFLQWFKPLVEWDQLLTTEWKRVRGVKPSIITHPPPKQEDPNPNPMRCYTIILLHLNYKTDHDLCYEPFVQIYGSGTTPFASTIHPVQRDIQKMLFIKNSVIPREIWPSIDQEAPWEQFPSHYSAKVEKDLEIFKNNNKYKASAQASNTSTSSPPTSNCTMTFSPGPSTTEFYQDLNEDINIAEYINNNINYQDPVFQDAQDPYDLSEFLCYDEPTDSLNYKDTIHDDISDEDNLNLSPSHEPITFKF